MRAVLLRCDAGAEDGLGHLMRCLVLADAFRAAGVGATFYVGGGDRSIADRVTARGHTMIAAPDVVGTPVDIDALARQPRDVLILDSRRTTAAYANRMAQGGFVACIDDDGMTGLNVDVVLNPSVDATAERYPARQARTSDLLGPAYNLIDPGFFAHAALRDQAAHALITFGGEDPLNHSFWTIENLSPALKGIRISVVVGPAHPDPASVARAARTHTIEVISAPISLVTYVQSADLALSAGGGTCYELAAAGVPTLAIAIEPHQDMLIDALARHGACAKLGAGFEIGVARARETVCRFAFDAESRRAMRDAQARLFPGPGAARAVQAIQAAYRKRVS